MSREKLRDNSNCLLHHALLRLFRFGLAVHEFLVPEALSEPFVQIFCYHSYVVRVLLIHNHQMHF
jgi:hypothetical protein